MTEPAFDVATEFRYLRRDVDAVLASMKAIERMITEGDKLPIDKLERFKEEHRQTITAIREELNEMKSTVDFIRRCLIMIASLVGMAVITNLLKIGVPTFVFPGAVG